MNKKCPYCGENMTLGNIRAAGCHEVWWFPLGEAGPMFLIHSNNKYYERGGILLGNDLLVSPIVESYYCKNCHKIVIDCDEINAKKKD